MPAEVIGKMQQVIEQQQSRAYDGPEEKSIGREAVRCGDAERRGGKGVLRAVPAGPSSRRSSAD